MNKKSNYSYLDNIVAERIDPNNEEHNFEAFKNKLFSAAKNNKNIDIHIAHAELNFISNLLALQELIKHAKKEIRIFTSDIRDDIYGQAQIMYHMQKWLDEDKERKIKFLLKRPFKKWRQAISIEQEPWFIKMIKERQLRAEKNRGN